MHRIRILLLAPLLTLSVGAFGNPAFAGKSPVRQSQPLPAYRFSDPPKPEEFLRSRILPEPLVPAGGVPKAAENRALAQALVAFHNRARPDDFTRLEAYLERNPKSPWKAAVALNLGTLYFKTGYLTRSLQVLRDGWNASKAVKELQGKRLADQVFSELVMMCSRLGRMETMDTLFLEAGDRQFEGPAAVGVLSSRESLFKMRHHSLETYKCGPTALLTLIQRDGSKPEHFEAIATEPSTPKGMSLKQVADLSRKVGMKYRMARRQPGAPLIVPSVLHWKQRHFSALLEQTGTTYHIVDPTFGEDLWVTREALDAEASGYFLIPDGPLPAGWTEVNDAEASEQWGALGFVDSDKDATSSSDSKVGGAAGGNGSTPGGSGSASGDGGDGGNGGGTNGGGGGGSNGDGDNPSDCPSPTGMPVYSFHAMVASLNITDAPVGHVPPRGPSTRFRVTYNHREAGQPFTFSYSNMGPKWNFGWLAYLTDNASYSPNYPTLYPRHGGRESYTFVDNTYTMTKLQEISQTRMHRLSFNPPVYERLFADGSKEVYSQSDGATSGTRRVFLTHIIDRQGDTLRFLYDSLLRVTKAVDALGQESILSYELGSDPYKVTKVTDPFGRWAGFTYTPEGRLKRIRDVLGLESEFTYFTPSSDLIVAMTTPYGTTRFSVIDSTELRYRSLEATDPMGRTERLEFQHHVQEIGAEPLVPSGMATQNTDAALRGRNSYYWDKNAMLQYPGDHRKALIYHWTGGSALEATARIPASVKPPLESRIWFNYPNQTNPEYNTTGMLGLPSHVGRVLDDSTTQLYRYEYDSFGNVSKSIDPLGRETRYTYDSTGIDLLSVRQKNGVGADLLDTLTYNSRHLPLTARNASGQTWTYTYNSRGQVLTSANPRGEQTSYTYDADGYLIRITGAVAGDTTLFTYDSYGRVRTVTNRDGYIVRNEYDAMDRLTKVVYPDSTYQEFVYDKLDLGKSRDRRGRWSNYFYNAVRELNSIRDPLGRTTTMEWCGCGNMESLTDPEGRTTKWSRDVQGRIIEKKYHDGRTLAYAYQNSTSLLRAVTDARDQIKNFQYFKDGNLKSISYTNAHVATPTVSYTYDSVYNRVSSMTDGVGLTQYAYHPITVPASLGAGRLAVVDGPWSNDSLTFAYDSLGRVRSTRIQGVLDSVEYDSLGRMIRNINALGTFEYRFVGATGRLDSLLYPNGQKSVYSYHNVAGDLRLQEIKNLNPAVAQLSRFAYTYDAEGQIKTWTQQSDSAVSQVHHLTYDPVDQLLGNVVKRANTGAVLRDYSYAYDKAGNRISAQQDSVVHTFGYNTLNQLTSRQGGGRLRFRGHLSEPGNVTLDGAAASVGADSTFDAQATVRAGLDTVTVVARDYSDNARTNRYAVSTVGASTTYSYDLNGNLTDDGTRTYEWDAENRLVAINNGTLRSEFTYDGQDRRVRIMELDDGNVTSQRSFLWVGNSISEERDASGGTVTKRYFLQGVKVGAGRFYYTHDHLGSLREMTDSIGSVTARYTYDPFGTRTAVSGGEDADFGFTGHFLHGTSGLHLAKYRAYSSELGRWISRDPIEEDGGNNLYAYLGNDPVNLVDPLGLRPCRPPGRRGRGNGPGREPPAFGKPERDAWGNERPDPPSRGKTPGDVVREMNGSRNNSRATPAPSAPVPQGPSSNRPSSPNQMNEEVRRGQAPPDVTGVHRPHPGNPKAQPHIHYNNGTSSNRDGTTHDAHRGTPNPPNSTRDWISNHGWTPPPR